MREIFDRLANIQTELFTNQFHPFYWMGVWLGPLFASLC